MSETSVFIKLVRSWLNWIERRSSDSNPSGPDLAGNWAARPCERNGIGWLLNRVRRNTTWTRYLDTGAATITPAHYYLIRLGS